MKLSTNLVFLRQHQDPSFETLGEVLVVDENGRQMRVSVSFRQVMNLAHTALELMNTKGMINEYEEDGSPSDF